MGAVGNVSRARLGLFGAWLLLFGAALGALTVFAALVPGNIGVWPRFEAGGMAMFLSAGVCAVGLAVVWFDDRAAVEAALRHPLVLAVMLVALASGLYAPFGDYPWLSIFGYPLLGEGVLRYAAMGVFFATAIVLRGDARGFRLLLICLLVGSVGGTAALFAWVREDFVSLDIAGILVVSAWVGAWYLMPAQWGWKRFAVSAAAVAPILILATSDTAIAATVAIGLPASALVYFNLKRPFVSDRTTRIIVAAALVAVPFAGLLAVWIIPMLTDALPSITSRKFNYQIVFAALRADPAVVFAGQGWGEMVMTLDRFRTFSDAILWDGSWDGASRAVSHSQNNLLDALFGGGFIAVVGILAVPAIAVLVCAKRELPVAVFAVSVFAVMGALWPQVAMTVGPVALALGVVTGNHVGTATPKIVGRASAWMLPVLASILIASGLWAVTEGLHYQRSVADVREKGSASPHACRLLPNSAAYGDLGLVQGFVKAYRPVFNGAQQARFTSVAEDRLIASFLCTVQRRAAQSTSPSLHLGMESFRAHVSSDAGQTPAIAKYEDSLTGWSDMLIRMLNAVPTRTDMTTVFATARMQAGAWETVGSLARALVQANPDDPVANWYLGRYLLNNGDPASRATGIEALRKSLNDGIKRIIPVSEEVEKLVREATGEPGLPSELRP
tara:strand:- start:138049 stop:140064 length:2016 start_codon:yes stop_codon:yes gene_type:complete